MGVSNKVVFLEESKSGGTGVRRNVEIEMMHWTSVSDGAVNPINCVMSPRLFVADENLENIQLGRCDLLEVVKLCHIECPAWVLGKKLEHYVSAWRTYTTHS